MPYKKLTPGMKVIISENLAESRTKSRFNIDGTGHMLRMQGNEYRVKEIVTSEKIRIYCDEAGRSFVFDPDDLEPVVIDSVKPKEFLFDASRLDI